MDRENKKKGIVIDRYSIIVIMFIVSIIFFFILIKTGKVKYSFVPMGIVALLGIINTQLPGRIRRNEYEGEIYYKGESDCGATLEPQKDIDGVYLNGKYYKTANGTDILIDKDGDVSPAGFGSRMINHLDGGGYLNEAPDVCWLIQE